MSPTVDEVNSQASVLMKRGILLMNDGRPEALLEALDLFDRARGLRDSLPVDRDPILRYGLAACWLNRAEALARLGGDARMAAALLAYTEGIALMRTLPAGGDERFPRRLAIAHQNHGMLLHAQHRIAEAAASFREAIAILSSEHATSLPDRQYLLAAIWMNLGSACESDLVAAQDAAMQALGLVKETEADNVASAEVGIKARYVLCRMLATRLASLSTAGQAVPEEVHEATDLVDEALVLVRSWEHRQVTQFRGIACDLFRFGARLYGKYQPQFLNDFVLDNIDPTQSSPDYAVSPEMRFAAQEAVGPLWQDARDPSLR